VIDAAFKEEEAYHAAEAYLQNHPEVTAVFAASDLMAIGFMTRCRELGVSIPERLSIMGFDDIVLSSYTTPKLSTVRQDFEKIGYSAFEEVVKMLENRTEGFHKFLSFEVIDRESVKVQ
jgi:LacI family transcriptional regulator